MKPMREIFRSHCVFDANGRHIGGTDRQSNHSYGDAYDSIITDRDAIHLMMEVGTADGSCLRAWREAFPNAHIVGLDIHICDATVGKSEPRLETHVGDQRSHADCVRAAQGRQFDLIIEDAYHSIDNTLLTLFWLWPFVKPGGIYVVEEWQDIGSSRENVKALFQHAQIIDTISPCGAGIESLVVMRKPL